ncbi:retrotransposon gag protein [Cucumis melo var. makuwa]|uniref:Retrotransposon gag protein n=1 Tax=Cucumis melo var. makuwa TaxID=1194695 RepID=A0A5D3C875_CUCMM|nr:retrotransposon gag protein [Cucumis melo var. makuwa]
MTTNSQNKDKPIKDDDEGWIVVARRKGRQTNFIQTKSHSHKKYAKGSISHKKKTKRNKMWKPKSIKRKDEDFLRPQRSINFIEFLPRSFIDDNPKEVLEVTTCLAVSIAKVDNYASSEEVDNSN